MVKSLAQSEAQTRQTDDSDPDNRLPEMSDPTWIFSRIRSQYLSAPRSTHYAAILRILWYLKGTVFHGPFYSAQSPRILCAFSDADWVGDPTNRRSTNGYCFFLGSSLISWKSKKQTYVTCSNTEAEYRVLADTISEPFWLRWLLKDLGVSTSSATLFIVTTRVLFILFIMIYSMNGLNTSRSIVILSIIILSMVFSSWSQFSLKINL